MDIKIIGNSIYDLQMKASNTKLEIMNKQKELKESEVYKQLEQLQKEEREMNELIELRKKHIIDAMKSTGLKTLEFEHQKITLKRNPGSLLIDDESIIQDEYKKEKTTVSIDKKKLKEAFTSGEAVVPGVSIKYTHSLLITPK